MKKLFKNKKGTIALYISFIFTSIIIILIAAVFAPMGVLFNSKMYVAGQDILLRANDSLEKINDATVQDRLQGVVGSAYESAENNIEINSNLFQYSWILIVGLGALIAFIYSRRLVEYGSVGGFI